MSQAIALKLIESSMDIKQMIAWFEAERSTLTMTDHSHIANLPGVGITKHGTSCFMLKRCKSAEMAAWNRRGCEIHKKQTMVRL
ncbi:MAG: hypothetical protein MK110_16145 [Fuerstiella sp.]|nr:hypothetical protein [Fuerstiella sp.]